MASIINAGTTTLTPIQITGDTSGILQLQTNGGTTAVTIDTSQRVGIGTASPNRPLEIYSSSATPLLRLNNTPGGGNNGIEIIYSSSYKSWLIGAGYNVGGGLEFTRSTTNGGTTFTTPDVVIDNSGNLLVGLTSAALTPSGNGFAIQTYSGYSVLSIGHVSGTSSGSPYAWFTYNGSAIGSITQNGTTAVLYNNTSDYRLKSNVQPVTTGLSIINQLNPVNFTWISDNEADTGFLAHEFQAIIPRSVTGEKDATKTEEYEITPAVKDENGNVTTPAVMGTRTVPVYQQMDNSGAVPYLVAAIKELSAKVTALEAKVA